MTEHARAWPVVVSAGVGLAILVSLGTWQVFRLQDKQALIAQIDARIAAASVDGRVIFSDETVPDFTKVTLQGHLLAGSDLFKLTSVTGGPGFQVLSPLLTSSNGLILVDRGAVSEDQRTALKTETGLRTYTGILRIRSGKRGVFDPDNDPKANQWYWWDVPAMLAKITHPVDAKVSPYVLQLLPDPSLPPLPKVEQPKAELRNNHLGYAITWFGLAATLAAVTFAFLRRRKLEEPVTRV
jgi:surfeit locus 1 family protein